jgi:hypothetical protein
MFNWQLFEQRDLIIEIKIVDLSSKSKHLNCTLKKVLRKKKKLHICMSTYILEFINRNRNMLSFYHRLT